MGILGGNGRSIGGHGPERVGHVSLGEGFAAPFRIAVAMAVQADIVVAGVAEGFVERMATGAGITIAFVMGWGRGNGQSNQW
jgi:hypothetical protein